MERRLAPPAGSLSILVATNRSTLWARGHENDPPFYFETHVFVCGNRRPDGHERGDCASKGSEKIRDYMKARVKELKLKNIRINQSGCLDRCELGPCAVIYPEGVWYRLDSFETADKVLEAHIMQGGRVVEKQIP